MANRKETAETVAKLVTLATDKATTEEEARTAAMQVVKLMAEEQLTVVPVSIAEQLQKTIDGANLAVHAARKDASAKLFLGAVLGFVGAKYLVKG
jgi:hypothetical protein